jgi:hypothetical protein
MEERDSQKKNMINHAFERWKKSKLIEVNCNTKVETVQPASATFSEV